MKYGFLKGLLIGTAITSLVYTGLNIKADNVDMKSNLEDVVESKFNSNTKSTIVREIEFDGMYHKININSMDYFETKNMFHPSLFENLEFYVTPENPYIKKILIDILKVPSENKEQDAQKILDFVHKFNYIPDEIEYPKKPIETIVDGGGDCEDLSLLAYTLMSAIEIDSILISIPPYMDEEFSHVLMGIAGDYLGYSVKYNETDYFLAETTGTLYSDEPSNWSIGDLPLEEWSYLNNIDVYKL